MSAGEEICWRESYERTNNIGKRLYWRLIVTSEDAPRTYLGVSMKFKTISKEHVYQAMTDYLRSLSMIEDDEHVVKITPAPNEFDIKIERIKE